MPRSVRKLAVSQFRREKLARASNSFQIRETRPEEAEGGTSENEQSAWIWSRLRSATGEEGGMLMDKTMPPRPSLTWSMVVRCRCSGRCKRTNEADNRDRSRLILQSFSRVIGRFGRYGCRRIFMFLLGVFDSASIPYHVIRLKPTRRFLRRTASRSILRLLPFIIHDRACPLLLVI